MKIFKSLRYTAIGFATFLASFTQANALDTTVKVMVRQMQVDADGNTIDASGNPTGLSIDKYFNEIDLLEGEQVKEGSFTALIEIGEYGSMFYLYVESLESGELEELASKFVSAYESPIATAEIVISSQDDYVPVRTRADETFSLKITTLNETWKSDVADGSAPEISWNPYTVKVTPSYNVTDDSDAVTATFEQTSTYLNSESTASNVYQDSRITVIPSPSRGKEIFTIEGVSQKDSSGNDMYKPIDEVSIEIWPVAQGKFEGVQNGDTFTKSMPNITAKVWHLYPESKTYLEVFKLNGDTYEFYVRPPVADKLDYDVTMAASSHGTESQPNEIVLTNWDSQIQNNGTYALKVFTVTPFHNGEPELVTEVTGIVVDRQITLKGGIITSESE